MIQQTIIKHKEVNFIILKLQSFNRDNKKRIYCHVCSAFFIFQYSCSMFMKSSSRRGTFKTFVVLSFSSCFLCVPKISQQFKNAHTFSYSKKPAAVQFGTITECGIFIKPFCNFVYAQCYLLPIDNRLFINKLF